MTKVIIKSAVISFVISFVIIILSILMTEDTVEYRNSIDNSEYNSMSEVERENWQKENEFIITGFDYWMLNLEEPRTRKPIVAAITIIFLISFISSILMGAWINKSEKRV